MLVAWTKLKFSGFKLQSPSLAAEPTLQLLYVQFQLDPSVKLSNTPKHDLSTQETTRQAIEKPEPQKQQTYCCLRAERLRLVTASLPLQALLVTSFV